MRKAEARNRIGIERASCAAVGIKHVSVSDNHVHIWTPCQVFSCFIESTRKHHIIGVQIIEYSTRGLCEAAIQPVSRPIVLIQDDLRELVASLRYQIARSIG